MLEAADALQKIVSHKTDHFAEHLAEKLSKLPPSLRSQAEYEMLGIVIKYEAMSALNG